MRRGYQSLAEDGNLNNDLVPFLTWTKNNIFELEDETSREKIASVVGFTVGGVSATVMFYLGAGFGDVVTDLLNIESDSGHQFMRGFFGANCIIPMVSLGAIAGFDRFKQLASPRSIQADLIFKKNKKYLRNSLYFIAHILGVFSAIPQGYLAYVQFLDYSIGVRLFINIPAFIGPFLFNTNAELQLIDRTFNALSKGETEVIVQRRISLKSRINLALSVISQMSDSDRDRFSIQIFSSSQSDDLDETLTLGKIKAIYLLAQDVRLVNSANNKPKKTWGRTIAGGLGFLTGMASAYIYYTLTEQATVAFCDAIGIDDDETRDTLKNFFGSLAYIPNASLAAVNTQSRFEQFYDLITKNADSAYQASWSKLRKYVARLSIVQGVLSSTSLGYVAITSSSGGPWYLKALIAPAFLGPASVRSRSIEQLINRGIDWTDNRFFNTPKTRGDNLVKAIAKINDTLDRIDDKQICTLHEQIFADTQNIGGSNTSSPFLGTNSGDSEADSTVRMDRL